MDETVNKSARDLKDLEFTPIGYVREKQNGKRTKGSIGDDDQAVPRRKTRRTSVNESFNSTKMFNDDSQFDETIPQLRSDKEGLISDKRNLMEELKENAPTSNPLKEQQEQMHRLNTENYNLRLKCNSLLKFLNNVTDQGELKKSLGLLDEIHDWKQRYERVTEDLTVLKRKYEDLEDKAMNSQVTTPPPPAANDELQKFEERYLRLQDESRAREEQMQMKIDMLKSDLNTLNITLTTKDNDLEEQAQKIQRLGNQLQEFDHKGSESLLQLEKQLDLKTESVRNLEQELAKHKSLFEGKDDEIFKCREVIRDLEKKLSSFADYEENSSAQKRIIDEKNDKITRLSESNLKLNQEIVHLKNDQDKQRNVSNVLKAIEKDLEGQKKELADTRQKLKEANELSKSLENQIIENTTKASEKNSTRVREKEAEIQKLKDQLKTLKESHHLELKNSQEGNDYEKRRLSREVSLLREEVQTIQESYDRELEVWKTKCESLNKENERLINQEIGSIDVIKKKLNDKLAEIKHLNNLVEQLKIEKTELNDRSVQLLTSKDRYKEELKKIVSKFEHLSKEYIRLRETKEAGIDDAQGSSSWREKYNTMKQRLLDELKLLQQENLSLERKLLESRSKNIENGNQQQRSSSNSQDRIDYYKLKYHGEVKQNDDLKTMNEYLNRVLRAISQHVRLDLLKIKNEVGSELPTYFTSYRQHLRSSSFTPVHRPSFKTIALFVQACVRMKQTALRRRWDEQRLHYLQRKMALQDDRISW